MKKPLFAAAGFVMLCGCASYQTVQTDNSYEKTNIVRQITTRVKATTFWSAKSELAKSAVVNTDKSQSSRVGAVNQQATNNAEQIVRIVIEKAP